MAEKTISGTTARKPKNYNVSYIRRKMKEYGGGQYRVAKEAPDAVVAAVEKQIKKITMDAAVLAMNAGRRTIKAKDVEAALKISSADE